MHAVHVLHRARATAVVVADDAAFGLMRMFPMLLEDVALLRAFRTLAEAEEWLRSVSADSDWRGPKM
jgi:hypothetical protein